MSNWVDKQNIQELVSQLSYKQIQVEWENGSRERNKIVRICEVIEFYIGKLE